MNTRADNTDARQGLAFSLSRQGVGKVLMAMVAGLMLLLFVMDRWAGHPVDAATCLQVVFALSAGVSWNLLRLERYVAVTWLMVSVMFLSAAASAYFFGTSRTVNIFLIAAGQVAAGIFLNRKALVWTTLAAVALLCAMSWADTSGLLMDVPIAPVGLRTWFAQAAALAGVAAMVYFKRTQMLTAQTLLIREARQRLRVRIDRDEGYERFKLIFRSSPSPIFVQSVRTGAILDVNSAFEKATGYVLDDVLDRRDGFLWAADAESEAFMQSRRRQARTEWLPITCVTRDGTQKAFLICSEMDQDAADSLIITVMHAVQDKDVAHGLGLSPPAQPSVLGTSVPRHSPGGDGV